MLCLHFSLILLSRKFFDNHRLLKAARNKKWVLGRKRGGGVKLGQHSNWWGIWVLVRRKRAISQVGGFGDRKVWGTSLCCKDVQKVCFWVLTGRKDNGGVEPGAEGLKAGLWDHCQCSHLPPYCSDRVLSQGTRGHNRGLLLSPSVLCLMPGTRDPSG